MVNVLQFFSGTQRQITKGLPDLKTVQGIMDVALCKLKTSNTPNTYLASRYMILNLGYIHFL